MRTEKTLNLNIFHEVLSKVKSFLQTFLLKFAIPKDLVKFVKDYYEFILRLNKYLTFEISLEISTLSTISENTFSYF